MTQINIGDKVKVVDTGKCYSTYQTWANLHGLQNYANKDHIYIDKGTIATVVAKGEHLTDNVVLLGLCTDQGKEYIIDERGVEMTTSSVKAMLTNGRRVRLRNNEMFTIIDDALVSLDNNWSLALKHQSATVSQSYNEVGNNWFHKEFDIVQIYERPASVASYFNYAAVTDTIWTREEKTESEKQLKIVQDQIQTLTEQAIKLGEQIKLEKL